MLTPARRRRSWRSTTGRAAVLAAAAPSSARQLGGRAAAAHHGGLPRAQTGLSTRWRSWRPPTLSPRATHRLLVAGEVAALALARSRRRLATRAITWCAALDAAEPEARAGGEQGGPRRVLRPPGRRLRLPHGAHDAAVAGRRERRVRAGGPVHPGLGFPARIPTCCRGRARRRDRFAVYAVPGLRRSAAAAV